MNTIEYKLIAFGKKYLIRDIRVIRGQLVLFFGRDFIINR